MANPKHLETEEEIKELKRNFLLNSKRDVDLAYTDILSIT